LTSALRKFTINTLLIEFLDPSTTNAPDHIGRADVFVRQHAPVRAERYQLEGQHRQHDHSFVEIALVTGGSGTHRTLHGDRPLQRGDTIVLRPGVWHAYLDCVALEVFNCYVGDEVLHRELAWMLEDPVLSRLFSTLPRSLDREGAVTAVLDEVALEDCLGWLTQLELLSKPDRPPERAELLAYLLLVLGRIARQVAVTVAVPSSASVPQSVLVCIRLIEDDPARAWTLSDLARHTQLNASHLSRLFTRATGLPPMAYLGRWRLERAAALLAQTTRAVAEIGAEVGWLDANLFARRFRADFGMNASAYRTQWTTGSTLEVT